MLRNAEKTQRMRACTIDSSVMHAQRMVSDAENLKRMRSDSATMRALRKTAAFLSLW